MIHLKQKLTYNFLPMWLLCSCSNKVFEKKQLTIIKSILTFRLFYIDIDHYFLVCVSTFFISWKVKLNFNKENWPNCLLCLKRNKLLSNDDRSTPLTLKMNTKLALSCIVWWWWWRRWLTSWPKWLKVIYWLNAEVTPHPGMCHPYIS